MGVWGGLVLLLLLLMNLVVVLLWNVVVLLADSWDGSRSVDWSLVLIVVIVRWR